MKIRIVSLFFTLLLLATFAVNGEGLKAKVKYPGVYRPMHQEFANSALLGFRADIIDKENVSFTKDTLIIDFEKRQVTFARYDTTTGLGLWKFHYGELEDYLRAINRHTNHHLWKEVVVEKGRVKLDKKKDKGLTFALPVNMPSWAKRVMGNTPPKLAITGQQSIKVGAGWSRFGIDGQKQNHKKEVQPIFEPNSNFSIKGSVGRLLSMEITLAGDVTEDDFLKEAGDQLSQIKIHYKADSTDELEDDIIQEVVIGKTSFDMEGVGLVGYPAGSNEGLFGIKIRSRIGPLDLTGVASIEQVENQQKTITIGETAMKDSIGEERYAKNTFFFLDSSYLQSFIDGGATPTTLPSQVRLFRKINGAIKADDKYAYYNRGGEDEIWAFRELVEGSDFVINSTYGWVIFKNGINDNDLIGMFYRGGDGTIKGDLTTVDVDVVDEKGVTKTKKAYKNLWVLKMPKSESNPSDSTYALMMRNVYNIGRSDVSSFEFSLERKSTNGDLTDIEQSSGKRFDNIMGLADDKKNVYTQNPDIFDLTNGYLVIPSFDASEDTTLNSLYPFTNPDLGSTNDESNINLDIYNDKATDLKSNFVLITNSVKASNSFNLDFGVRPNSESLKADGIKLVRDEDYTIDYSFGQVTLVSPRAQGANKIEADYQKESLFMLENKVFLGLSGRLDLPGLGRNSFISTTALWQLVKSKNLTPKVGTEPYNRFSFGSNLTLDFEPYWMTSLVDRIPLIKTDAPSTARFSVEVARSSVTNSSKKKSGAYIDNFSTSAGNYTLGTNEKSWYRAAPSREWVSTPVLDTVTNEDDTTISVGDTIITELETNDESYLHPPAWHSYWIQPAPTDDANRSRKREIYNVDTTNAKEANEYMSTLRLIVQPFPEDSSLLSGVRDGANNPQVKPWAGITRGLSGSLVEHQDDRFFEFWIRSSYRGKLYIDLGEIAEDIVLDGKSPNRVYDRETDNNTVTEETDLGLDRLADADEKYYYPSFEDNGTFTSWKELGYDSIQLGEFANDPAKDNWTKYDKDNLDNKFGANGTHRNLDAVKSGDQEDINRDGSFFNVDMDRYFRYTIELNASDLSSSPFYDKYSRPSHTGADPHWHHIRLPIGKVSDTISSEYFDTVSSASGAGVPSWNLIRHVRFLWSGLDESDIATEYDSLEFEGMQFVGNQWRQPETLFSSGGADTISADSLGTIVATVMDSKTTIDYSKPFKKELDKNGTVEQTDYTLRLEYKDVLDSATVTVQRQLSQYEILDLTRYRELKFWANDTTKTGENINTDNENWLVFRFGNSDSSYYEFKTKRVVEDGVRTGWDGDGFTINLDTITQLKLDWFNKYGERNENGIDTTIETAHGDLLSIYSSNRNMPTLSALSWLSYGIENGSGDILSGEIWINGLSVSGISNYEGWAAESDIDLEFADFISMGGRYGYRDAHFRTMSQDITTTTDAKMDASFNGEVSIDKFIPSKLGINIPLGGEIATDMRRPEMRSNSDIRLTDDDGNVDGFMDMGSDFLQSMSGKEGSNAITESEKYQKQGSRQRVYVKYNKNRDSNNPVVNLLADRVALNYNFRKSEELERSGKVPEVEKILVTRPIGNYHVVTSDNRSHQFNFDYNLTPGRKTEKVTSWEPFKKSKGKIWSSKVKRTKLNLLPSKVDFKLFDVAYDWSDNYSSINDVLRDSSAANVSTIDEKLGIRHSFDMTYKPIAPFSVLNYSLGMDRDFEQYLKSWEKRGVDDFVDESLFSLDPIWKSYGMLFKEQRRNQNGSISLTPDIFKWLSLSTSLTGSYTQNLASNSDTSLITSADVGSKYSASSTFRIRRLFEIMGKAGSGKNGFANVNKGISKGFNAIDLENLTFTYNANMALSNNKFDPLYFDKYLDGNMASYLAYTFGVKGRSVKDIMTGNMDDINSFAGVQHRNSFYTDGEKYHLNDKRVTTQSYTLSSAIKIPSPIDFSINRASIGWRRTYNTTFNADRFDTSITWPEIRISGNTPVLESISSVKSVFRSLKLETGYTYMNTTRRNSTYFMKNDTTSLVTRSVTIKHGFDPLVKVTGTLKKKRIDMSYGISLLFDSTESGNEKVVTDKKELEYEFELSNDLVTVHHSVTGGYKVKGRKGRTLKLFRDRVIELVGDSRYNLTFDLTTQEYKEEKPEESIVRDEDSNNHHDYMFSFRPEFEYQITKDIKFQLYYSLAQSVKDKEKNFITSSELAGEITISF